MSTATKAKVEVYPEREYIAKGIKEGWVTIQLIGMKHIIIDHDYQARVIPLDMAHVKLLADTRTAQIDSGQGEYLFPIVVFETPKGKYLLADGFHRHEENRLRKGVSIMAYVVKVEDYEHEARLYSAMCNRLALKQRKKEDVKKAVEMLFADPECWKWADNKIGVHCGVGSSNVRIWRKKFSDENTVDIPDTVIDTKGIERTYRISTTTGIPSVSQRKGSDRCKGQFRSTIGGKEYYIGSNISKEEALVKAQSIFDNINISIEERKRSLGPGVFYKFLSSNLIPYETLKETLRKIDSVNGIKIKGAVIVTCDFDDKKDIPWAFGSLHAIRKLAGGPQDRLVVVCYREDGPPDSIKLFGDLGIEFLAPDELVASLKLDNESPNPEPPTS